MKTCSKCKLEKKLEDFYEDKRRNNRRAECKICMSKYFHENKDIINIRKRKWRNINKKELNLKRSIYEKNKRKNNIQFKLGKILRTRLGMAISNNYKSGSAVSDLGCSIEKFKLWLEMHWEEGMSWENYGRTGWHIDHVKPLDSFDLTDRKQFLEACHFSNLQPMWAKDNLSKGNKILCTQL